VPAADVAGRASPITVGFDHVSLRVRDYDASLAWYRDVLDLPVLHEWTEPELPGLRLCHLQLGAIKLELIGGGAPDARTPVHTVAEHMRPAGVIHLCLTVPDLRSATDQLHTRGVTPFAGPTYVEPLDITLIVIKDNSGNVLEISQPGHTIGPPAPTGP
jgi:catechol 2,3-dioxygenase-like lactoylglutathione lyase family enzyme